MPSIDIVAVIVGAVGGLWRRALGGWGPLPGGMLRAVAPVLGLPLFLYLPWPAAAVVGVASYLHFMPSHTGLLDFGDTGSDVIRAEFWRDFGGMALRYTAVPAALAYAGTLAGYRHLELLPLVGLVTALGYALGYAARHLRLYDAPTETGECVMGAAFWLAVMGGTMGNV